MLNSILTAYFSEFKSFFTCYSMEMTILFVSTIIIMVFAFIFSKKGN